MLKRYTLTGDIDLAYEKRWFEDRDDFDWEQFVQTYSLGLSGYVLDPRIVYFSTKGYFTHQQVIDDDSSTFTGGYAQLTLFSKVLNRGFMNFVPKPINFWYSTYDSDDIKQNNYGIGLVYSRRGDAIKLFSREGIISVGPYKERRYVNNNNNNNNNNNSKGFKIAFPELAFDYNRYETEYKNRDNGDLDKDYYSFRLFSMGTENRLTFEYDYEKYSNTYEYDRNFIYAEHSFSKGTASGRGNVNMYNRYSYSNNELGSRTVTRNRFSHGTSWVERFGNMDENYRITEDINYIDREDSGSYAARLDLSLNKRIGSNLMDSVSVFGGYGDGDDVAERYDVGLSNLLTLYLPRLSKIYQGLTLVNTESGVDYGFVLGYEKSTRLLYATAYSYNVNNHDDLSSSVHRVFGQVSGPMARNISFFTEGDYRVSHTDDNVDPTDTLLAGYRLDIYWNFPRGNIGIGGIYQYLQIENSVSDDGSVKTVNGNAAYHFTRKLYATVLARWKEDINDIKETLIQSRLTWRIRKWELSVEYDYHELEGSVGEGVDHRFLTRLRRSFGKNFYF
jgi:hypothetical protein